MDKKGEKNDDIVVLVDGYPNIRLMAGISNIIIEFEPSAGVPQQGKTVLNMEETIKLIEALAVHLGCIQRSYK